MGTLLFFVATAMAQPKVTVPDALRACRQNGECAQVAEGCDGCCRYDAVRRDRLKEYGELVARACAGYEGPVCDCEPPKGEPRCVKGSCRWVRRK